MKKLIFSVFILSVSTILPLSGGCAALNSVSDTLGNTFVSAVCTHTVSFSSPNTAVIGRISIAFDPGFGISSILQGTVTGLNSGTLSVTGDTVIYTVIYPDTVAAEVTCTIPLGNITNAAVCAATYTIRVATRTPEDTVINDPTVSTPFGLAGNSLRITTPAQVVLSGSPSLQIIVIACDASGNTDILFNDTVTLGGSSASGLFSPDKVSWTAGDTFITLVSGKGSFYYADTVVGTVSVSVSREGYADAGYIQSLKFAPFITGAIPHDTPGTVIIMSDSVTVTVPAETFGSTYAFVIDDNPAGPDITTANNGTATDPGLKLVTELGGTIREISAYAVGTSGIVDLGSPLDPLAGKFVIVTIPYPDIAVISGTLEDGLRIFKLDETTDGWILVLGTQNVNKISKTVSADMSSLSIFRIISLGISQNLSGVIVYPNPFETAKARGGTLKFINIPLQATIKIYNIAGELVRTIQKDDTANRATWDAKNESGEKVASGVYFYVISSPQDTVKATGKIAVIVN